MLAGVILDITTYAVTSITAFSIFANAVGGTEVTHSAFVNV